MSVDYRFIGKRIQQKRKEKKWTQEQLAEKLGVTVGYVSQLERGITKINLDRLSEIGTLLETELSYFITGTVSGQNSYLHDELTEKIAHLNPNQRKMVAEIIDSILKNKP